MDPTPEQAEAVDRFLGGNTLKIVAFAGAGKTSTLKLMSDATPRRGLYVAFNKKTALEAERKFPNRVRCKTLHALAFGPMAKKFPTEQMTTSINGRTVAKELGLSRRQDFSVAALGKMVLDTVRYFRYSASSAIDPDLHFPRYGKIAALSDGARDALRWYVVDAATRLWHRMIDPDDDIPLDFDGYLKLWVMSNPRIRADYILMDEAQDSNPIALQLLARQDSQVVFVGDPHQQIYCQPSGTLVRVVTHPGRRGRKAVHVDVPIEHVEEGMRVVSWDGGSSVFHQNGDVVTQVSTQEHYGGLVVVTAGEQRSRYTPRHQCVVRLDESFHGQHLVYLMRRGSRYRIGRTIGRSRTQNNVLGLHYRRSQEGADACWVLSTHDTVEEAAAEELMLSWRFSVPSVTFRAQKNHILGQEGLDTFWEQLDPDRLYENVDQLLQHCHRDIRHPLDENGPLHVRRPLVTAATNLMDGMKVLPISKQGDRGRRNSRDRWVPIQVSEESYGGVVYSLTVASPHTYVADGIVTHNSWRGALDALRRVEGASSYLTKSFRFGQPIADLASHILRKLGESRAVQGNENLVSTWDTDSAPRSRVVICRTNGKMIEQFIAALEADMNPFVVGGVREMETELKNVKALQNGREPWCSRLLGFTDWDEVVEFADTEEGDDVKSLVRMVNRFGVDYLLGQLSQASRDEEYADVVLTTAHKAKGLEWPEVRLTDDFLNRAHPEEVRLAYVAATRGQEQVHLPPLFLDDLQKLNLGDVMSVAGELPVPVEVS